MGAAVLEGPAGVEDAVGLVAGGATTRVVLEEIVVPAGVEV